MLPLKLARSVLHVESWNCFSRIPPVCHEDKSSGLGNQGLLFLFNSNIPSTRVSLNKRGIGLGYTIGIHFLASRKHCLISDLLPKGFQKENRKMFFTNVSKG